MKTPNDIKSWVDMLLSRRPNVEDRNYLEAIKCYMDKVERPQGNWIEGTQGYYCSKCDAVDQFYFEHDFCPKCGADMRRDHQTMQ